MKRTNRNGVQLEPPPSPSTSLDGEFFGTALKAFVDNHEVGYSDDKHRPALDEQLTALPEPQLLGLMSVQTTHPALARSAWGELYRRHARYLYSVTVRRFGHQLSDDAASDVVVDTLQAAFDWAGRRDSFEEVVSRFDDDDPEAAKRRVLGWLSVIARRLAVHLLSTRLQPHISLTEAAAEDVGDAEPPLSTLSDVLTSAVSKLADDEIEVLNVSLPWYEPETGKFSFPRAEAARVAASLGISTETLRQRRHRTLKRIRASLAFHNEEQ